MGKFKVGDKVWRVRGVHMGMREGDGATVTKVTSYKHVELDAFEGQHSEDVLDLVCNDNPSPVRIVTRREIVPGVYGGVEVFDAFQETVNIGIAESFGPNFDSASLRSAARIFNEIADVLDEQKEAA